MELVKETDEMKAEKAAKLKELQGEANNKHLVLEEDGLLIQSQAPMAEDFFSAMSWTLAWEIIHEGGSVKSDWLPVDSSPPMTETLKAVGATAQKLIVWGRSLAARTEVQLIVVDYKKIQQIAYLAVGIIAKKDPVPVGISVKLKDGRMVEAMRSGTVVVTEK